MTGDYMDHSSRDVGEASDCDIEEYKEKAYEELKGGKHQIYLPNNAFTCPYCSTNTSRDYQYKELLHHATMVGKTDSKKRSKRERGSHLALAKYLEKDLTKACDGDEMFVWPWKVILANLPPKYLLGQYGPNFGQSDSDIREYLATRGFNPKEVHSLNSCLNHSGFAVIDFGKDWLGFYNAMKFEKAYEVDHHGKKDWNSENGSKSGIYGWVARGDDYTSIDVYGDHLRNSADVMTLSDIMADENSKRYKLKKNLTTISEARKRKYEEMERNYMETKNTLSKLIAEKDQIHQSHNEDMQKINMLDVENAKLKTELESQLGKTHALAQENGKLKEEITFQQKELEQRAKERDERESQIAQNMRALTKELEEKVTELEEELQYKDSLNQTLIIREHDSNKELQDAHKELINVFKKVDDILKDLQLKEEELKNVESLNQTLVEKERISYDALQDVRKEFIRYMKGLMKLPKTARIGMKMPVKLEIRPFYNAMKQLYGETQAKEKALELRSFWEQKLQDPDGHPFIVFMTTIGKPEEIVKSSDRILKSLYKDLGHEVYNALYSASREILLSRPKGKYITIWLWNFTEARKATPDEEDSFLLEMLDARELCDKRIKIG